MPRSVSPELSRERLTSLFPVPTERQAEFSALPVPRTSFVGREREVGLVQTLLRRGDVRLVTLTGPGGVGKTRTAIRAVSSAPHTAQFVDLADVQQPALVLPTIAATLGVRPDRRPALDVLRAVLRDGDYLLVLDNFEQVLPAASALADLLDACPNVKLLATSRAVLGVPGEHVVDIRPFSLPPLQSPGSEAHAVDFDACRLFVDRAQALCPEFALTSANARSIVSICQRLDGLPLAIELAASWVPVLSPSALLAQLEALCRGHWTIENRVHRVRDVTWGEDAGQVRVGHAPQALAALRNGLLSLLRALGWTQIADATRHYGAYAHRAMTLLSSPPVRL